MSFGNPAVVSDLPDLLTDTNQLNSESLFGQMKGSLEVWLGRGKWQHSHSQGCWEVPVCQAQWRSNAGENKKRGRVLAWIQHSVVEINKKQCKETERTLQSTDFFPYTYEIDVMYTVNCSNPIVVVVYTWKIKRYPFWQGDSIISVYFLLCKQILAVFPV